ncbi:hypothetical protein [Streptomyces sp. E5N91]|uniref:hypothetical protein n=1 Tax=Streptomyces sp. E5N91 TaxID=1851996 RepID=UPI001291ACAE|nr:hypothetical protein [Streptomyces sp. E5N91]
MLSSEAASGYILGMFVLFTQPLADVRAFIADTYIRPSLTWKDPQVLKIEGKRPEWIPKVGAIKSNPESVTVCEARRFLRFDAPLQDYAFKTGEQKLMGFQGQHGSRRYWQPQAAGSFQVRLEYRRGATISGPEAVRLARSVLQMRVKLRDAGQTTLLANCGPPIAKDLLLATTHPPGQKSQSEFGQLLGKLFKKQPALWMRQDWWVTAGRPMLLLIARRGGFRKLEDAADQVPLGKPGIRLYYAEANLEGQAISTWMIECERQGESGWVKGSPFETHDGRQVRLLLQRLHCEIECVQLVLDYLDDGRLNLRLGSDEAANLEGYAKNVRSLLANRRKYGSWQQPIIRARNDDIGQLVGRLDRLLRGLSPYIG